MAPSQGRKALFFGPEVSTSSAFLRDSLVTADCERRIDRCLAGMQNAKTWAWVKRWMAAYLCLKRERDERSGVAS